MNKRLMISFLILLSASAGCQSQNRASEPFQTPSQQSVSNSDKTTITDWELQWTPKPTVNMASSPSPNNPLFPWKKESSVRPAKSEPSKILLDVPLIKQNPELKNGCEVTSLAMLLQYAGVNVDKMELARKLPKDLDPVRKTESGDITHWGNPNHGFVGDVTGKRAGYAIYAEPLERLMNEYLPNRTVNLTGRSFDDVINSVNHRKPVILWTTGDYKLPDRWESWKHGSERIRTPLDLHAVVLVGVDGEHIYLNDPLSGKKAHRTSKAAFIKSWIALNRQALTYR